MSLVNLAKVWAPIVFAIGAIFAAGSMYTEFQTVKDRVTKLELSVQKLSELETKLGKLDQLQAQIETRTSSSEIARQLPQELLRSGDRVRILLSGDGAKRGLWMGDARSAELSVQLISPPSGLTIYKGD